MNVVSTYCLNTGIPWLAVAAKAGLLRMCVFYNKCQHFIFFIIAVVHIVI